MKPILFNTDMVQAILTGQKTVTRRMVKPQPPDNDPHNVCFNYIENGTAKFGMRNRTPHLVKLPYQPGDILYVRETWCRQPSEEYPFVYRASVQTPDVWRGSWRPSIHMPKEAVRIFLRVTDIRVERLQAIKKENVIKEGIAPKKLRIDGCKCPWAVDGCLEKPCVNREAYEEMCYIIPFAQLWDRTIKPADRSLYSWAANPWVWVIEFERCEKSEVQL